MATPSPQPPQTNGKTTPKLLETLGTLGRKKKIREGLSILFRIESIINFFFFGCYIAEAVQGIVQEGKQAIDGNEQHPVFDTSPESFVLGKLR